MIQQERKRRTTARVLFDYDADDEEKALPLREGEEIDIIRKLHHGWWLGKNHAGHVGRFPAALVQEDDEMQIEDEDPDPKQPSPLADSKEPQLHAHDADDAPRDTNSTELEDLGLTSPLDSKFSFAGFGDLETVPEIDFGNVADKSSNQFHTDFLEIDPLNESSDSGGQLEEYHPGSPNSARGVYYSEQLPDSKEASLISDTEARESLIATTISHTGISGEPFDTDGQTGSSPDYNVSRSIKTCEDLTVPVARQDLDIPIPREFSFKADATAEPKSMNSRSREVSPGSKALSPNPCDQCGKHRPGNAFCNKCKATFCGGCWDAQYLHATLQSRPAGEIHEKTDLAIAQLVSSALEAAPNDPMQEERHKADAETSWFGVVRDDGELPSFQDYGRYANLMASTRKIHRKKFESRGRPTYAERRYPSLVSFVGQTGAGKSSLIKLLVNFSRREPDKFVAPVVGTLGSDAPTSDDVHLYLDPTTATSLYPLLYADCEGLEGREREPVAARYKKTRANKSRRMQYIDTNPTKPRYTSKRELTWADDAATTSREFAVTNLYPRLLYTFSDVIVFVLKNPRTIERVFEKLIDWAAAALEKSSNQPVLPHAIIVLNALPDEGSASSWQILTATEYFLESLSRTIYTNIKFKKYAEFWRARKRRIDTVEQLFASYYSSVKIVRVPTGDRPILVQRQIRGLQSHIANACQSSRELKTPLRMLLDVEELNPYLQFAFDHFASTLDSPFDFVKASFTNSPIPPYFGGNVLKLAINMMEARPEWSAGDIFSELSPMVASCIMLDSTRHGIRGTAEQIFPNISSILILLSEISAIVIGLVNITKQDPSNDETFELDVYLALEGLLQRLQDRLGLGITEETAAAKIHESEVLGPFFYQASGKSLDKFVNHSVCYVCLMEPPEHVLPCGHILCLPCAKMYGKSTDLLVEMNHCPIEGSSIFNPWSTWMKPDAAGVRILSLDGGGIRGIVELAVLEQIERVLKRRLPIQAFFDMIIGTSTGGIIALALGSARMPIDKARAKFESLCEQAFTRRTGGNLPFIGWLVDNHNHSKYQTRPIQQALASCFTEDMNLFGGRPSYQSSFLSRADIKVAVTATSTSGQAVVLANYNRFCAESLPYHFARPEKSSAELKVWEAARATSAAPRIFKPFHHEATKQVYLDGAIYHNNPISVADRERKLVWPSRRNFHADIVLSIGTTFNPRSKQTDRMEHMSTPRLGVSSHLTSLLKIAQDHIASSLDSEKTWHDYLGTISPSSEDRRRFVRINPAFLENPPMLDDVASMKGLYEKVRLRLQGTLQNQVSRVALQLVATMFYFQPKEDELQNLNQAQLDVQGYIKCRIPSNSPELSGLSEILREHSSEAGLTFIVQEKGQLHETGKQIPLTMQALEQMSRREEFSSGLIKLKLSSHHALMEMFLHFKEGKTFPLSGFPRVLSPRETRKVRELGVRKNRDSAVRCMTPYRESTRDLNELTRRRKELVPPTQEARRRILDSKQIHLFGQDSRVPELPDTGVVARFARGPLRFFKTGTKAEILQTVNDLAAQSSWFTDPSLLRGNEARPRYTSSSLGSSVQELDGVPINNAPYELDGVQITKESDSRNNILTARSQIHEKTDEETRRQLMTLLFQRIDNDHKWL